MYSFQIVGYRWFSTQRTLALYRMQLAQKRQGGAGNPLYGQTRLCVREGSTLDASQEKMEGLHGQREKGQQINASNLLCNDKCSFTVCRRFCHPLLLYTIYYVQKYYVMCLFIISLQKFNITSCDTVYRHRLFLKLLSVIMNRNKRC